MNDKGFFDAFRRAARLPLHQVPDELHRQTVERSGEDPVPPPSESAPSETLLPEDIRSSTVEESTGGHMLTRSLPGVDITLMVMPPEGDGLWTLRGRVWLEDAEAGAAKVVLTQGENVLAVVEVGDGGNFELREVLGDDWVLEFHLADGRVSLLRGQWE